VLALGAEVTLNGLYVPAAGAHIDNHTRIEHAAPHVRSREHFRGIIASARRRVQRKVVVKPGAQKTRLGAACRQSVAVAPCEVDASLSWKSMRTM